MFLPTGTQNGGGGKTDKEPKGVGKVVEARPRPLIMYTYSSWSMHVQDTARSSFFVAAMCISFLARESQIMNHVAFG